MRKTATKAADYRDKKLNVDTLQAFMDTAFPRNGQSLNNTSDLVEELSELRIELRELVDAWERTEDLMADKSKPYSAFIKKLQQVGVVRFLLDVTNDVRHL